VDDDGFGFVRVSPWDKRALADVSAVLTIVITFTIRQPRTLALGGTDAHSRRQNAPRATSPSASD